MFEKLVSLIINQSYQKYTLFIGRKKGSCRDLSLRRSYSHTPEIPNNSIDLNLKFSPAESQIFKA